MRLLYSIVFLLLCNLCIGQSYEMQDALVRDCEGTLTDSNLGPEEGQYDHDEDYTFTICVEGAEQIILEFDFFATEEQFDVLEIYDGSDISATLLTSLTGVINPVPVIVGSSDCITLRFTTDDNIVASGWSMRWRTELEEFAEPELEILTELSCPSNNLAFQLSGSILCSSLHPNNFNLIGPGSVDIIDIVSPDCDSGSDSTDQFFVVFSDSLATSGSYQLLFSGEIINACGDTAPFNTSASFDLENCPLEIEAYVLQQSCPGDCGVLRVDIYDDHPGPHEITWSHTASSTQEVEICTDVPTEISVTVQNTVTDHSKTAIFWYSPFEEPMILNPLGYDTICTARGDHNYIVTPLGGEFYSRIIPDGERTSGKYQFWRWNSTSGYQEDIVTYISADGCEVQDTFVVSPIYAGLDEASCVGADSFSLLARANPRDGLWTGPHTSPEGRFGPVESGVFDISLTNEHGCQDWLRVTVIDEIIFSTPDTICSSTQIQLRQHVNALGGVWSGPGVDNWYTGRLRAWNATPDMWHSYTYSVNGCIDSTMIYIIGLDAGPDQSVCGSSTSIQLPFAGNWSGPGEYISADSSYDISGLEPGEYDITISNEFCSDAFKLSILDVGFQTNDTSQVCLSDKDILLRDILEWSPSDAIISGPGIVFAYDQYYFDPSEFGPGFYSIYLESSSCQDSVEIEILQEDTVHQESFCELSGIQKINYSVEGAIFSGLGIVDEDDGFFDPSITGVGRFPVYVSLQDQCDQLILIEVTGTWDVSIANLQEVYCTKDSNIILDISPADAEFYINDESQDEYVLNTALLGEGFYQLTVAGGAGLCRDEESYFISIAPAIDGSIQTQFDSICPDGSTTISVTSSGGFGDISSTWDNDLGFGTSHIIKPDESTTYSVTISDGCSDDLVLSQYIHVHDTISYEILQGPAVCHDEFSWAEVILNDPIDYEIFWFEEEEWNDLSIEANPGDYHAELTNLSTTCSQNIEVQVPGSPQLHADFLIVPNQECIDLSNNQIQLIDLSFGATSGIVNYGFGQEDTDTLFLEDLEHSYFDIGEYDITMTVFNDLGCKDSTSMNICVENRVKVYLPNVFSPNGDDMNDQYEVFSIGLEQLQLRIYNRWGQLVFESVGDDLSPWDGTFKGLEMEASVLSVVFSGINRETGALVTESTDLTLLR